MASAVRSSLPEPAFAPPGFGAVAAGQKESPQGAICGPSSFSSAVGGNPCRASTSLLAGDVWSRHLHNSRGNNVRNFRGSDPRKFLQNTDTANLCQEVLRESYREERAAAKAIAEDSGMSPKAAENWLAGENPMSLTAFVNAYRNNDQFKAWARRLLLDEQELDPDFEAHLSNFVRAVQQMGGPRTHEAPASRRCEPSPNATAAGGVDNVSGLFAEVGAP